MGLDAVLDTALRIGVQYGELGHRLHGRQMDPGCRIASGYWTLGLVLHARQYVLGAVLCAVLPTDTCIRYAGPAHALIPSTAVTATVPKPRNLPKSEHGGTSECGYPRNVAQYLPFLAFLNGTHSGHDDDDADCRVFCGLP